MSDNEKITILENLVFSLGSNLASMFISVYLYVYTESLVVMALYTVIRIGMFPLFFTIGSKITKKYTYGTSISIGLILISLSLIYALSASKLFEINSMFVLIAALLTGCGEGLYYLSANSLNVVVTSTKTKPQFMSYTGICGNIAALAAPLIANRIINMSSSDLKGYKIILGLIFAIYVLVIFIVSKLKVKSKDKDIRVSEAISLKNDPIWKDHCIAVLLYGLKESMTLILTSILLYNAVGSGDSYSKLQGLFAAVQIISFVLLKKALSKKYLKYTFAIGATLTIASTLVLVFSENLFGAVFFGITNALQNVFYANPYNFICDNIINSYDNQQTARVVGRETYLSIGRCTGMLFIVLCYFIFNSSTYLKVAISVLSIFPIFVYLILRKYI